MVNFIAKTRLFVETPLIEKQKLSILASQRHHLINVMRFGIGTQLVLFNGKDGEWSGSIMEVTKNRCLIKIEKKLRPQENCRDLWLMFAPIKRARLDFIAQKASELGVSCIWPVRTEFCQVTRINNQRLVANVIEAAQQTGRMDIAEVRGYIGLFSALEFIENDRLLIWCDESIAGCPEHNISAELSKIPTHNKAAILIGPEGGFALPERERLNSHKNCLKISLGSRILRADTAAIAALSCYQSICGDWNTKMLR